MKNTILAWLLILTSLTTFAADKPISGLTIYNGAPGTNDLIPFVSRADVTQSTNGSTRSMTWSNVNWSLRTSYPAMTLTNIGSSGGYVNVTNIIGYNGSTFYGSGAVVDNWVFYGNNTFTGDTNRFASTVLLTNMNNTVSGNGAGLTNISPANIVSNGTYLANGTLATNSGAISGGFLTETGTQRKYSLNAGSLTNIPAANLTGTAGTITAAGYTATQQTLAYSGTNVTVDATKSLHFLSISNTTYFAAPSGLAVGQSFTVLLKQDSTGTWPVSFNLSYWKFPGGIVPVIPTNANSYSVLSCVADPFGTNVFCIGSTNFQ